jgi:hypothetical protein
MRVDLLSSMLCVCELLKLQDVSVLNNLDKQQTSNSD